MGRVTSLNAELGETVNTLRKEVEEAETLINASQTDLTTCSEELEREQCLTIEIQSQLEEANIQEIFFQERICYLESCIPKSQDSTNTTQQADDTNIETGTQLSQDLKNQNQALSDKLEIMEEELTDARQSNSSLSKVNQNLEEGLSLLQTQVNNQSKEIGSLNDLNSNLTNEKLSLEDKLAAKDRENESFQIVLYSHDDKMALKCSEIDNLNKSVSSLRDENEIMRDQNSSVQSELEQIVGQLNSATNDTRQLTDKLHTTERDMLLERENNSTLQERVSLLERELREKEGERVELESLREHSSSAGILEQQLYASEEERRQLNLKVNTLITHVLESINEFVIRIQSSC